MGSQAIDARPQSQGLYLQTVAETRLQVAASSLDLVEKQEQDLWRQPRLAWGGGQQCAGSIATPQQDPGPRPPGTQFTILNARARVQGGTRAATGPFWPEYPEARLRCQAVGPQEETWTPMPTFAWSQRKSTIFKGMRWER